MTSNENETPTWEQSKENVVPIKKGRKLKGLTESLNPGIFYRFYIFIIPGIHQIL